MKFLSNQYSKPEATPAGSGGLLHKLLPNLVAPNAASPPASATAVSASQNVVPDSVRLTLAPIQSPHHSQPVPAASSPHSTPSNSSATTAVPAVTVSQPATINLSVPLPATQTTISQAAPSAMGVGTTQPVMLPNLSVPPPPFPSRLPPSVAAMPPALPHQIGGAPSMSAAQQVGRGFSNFKTRNAFKTSHLFRYPHHSKEAAQPLSSNNSRRDPSTKASTRRGSRSCGGKTRLESLFIPSSTV